MILVHRAIVGKLRLSNKNVFFAVYLDFSGLYRKI